MFLNGLPIAVFELKDPTDTDATLERAWNQLPSNGEPDQPAAYDQCFRHPFTSPLVLLESPAISAGR
jgi:type I site-specific restriction-modification system R (restriction) subunit